MLRKLRVLVLGVWVVCCGLGVARAELTSPPPLAALLAEDSYREVRISPDGQYLAAIVGNGDEPDELATFSLKEHKLVARFGFRDAGRSVGDYWWVKDHQLVMRPVDRSGYSEEPVFYGTLYAASADGGGFVPIIGFGVGGMQTGTRIKKAESKSVWGEFIADIDGNADSVLLQSTPQESSQGRSADGKVASPLSKVQRVKLSTGVAIDQMTAPAPDASFIASPSGVVHFAVAIDVNAVTQVYRYHHEREEWSLLASNPTAADLAMLPQAVSADGRYAWYLSSRDVAQKALFRLDLQSGARDKIFEDASRPVEEVLADPYSGVPYAVLLGQQLNYAPIDDTHPLAKASAALFKAFPDGRVEITSVSRDRSTAVARVSSERDPGVWYTVDLNSRKINLELTNLADVDPEALLPTRAVSLKARDGLSLSGYYTAPAKTGDARPPLVVLVHGGPYEVADRREFDPWVQTASCQVIAQPLPVNLRTSATEPEHRAPEICTTLKRPLHPSAVSPR